MLFVCGMWKAVSLELFWSNTSIAFSFKRNMITFLVKDIIGISVVFFYAFFISLHSYGSLCHIPNLVDALRKLHQDFTLTKAKTKISMYGSATDIWHRRPKVRNTLGKFEEITKLALKSTEERIISITRYVIMCKCNRYLCFLGMFHWRALYLTVHIKCLKNLNKTS